MHDSHTLSATSFLAKEPVEGSWWSHPTANEMYRAISEIDEHEDIAVVKLLGGKLTFVHRRLFPALLAVVTERADWQMKSLSDSALELLDQIEESNRIRADGIRELKREVKLIEDRLLAFVAS